MSEKTNSLESIRGLAAIAVVMHHLQLTYWSRFCDYEHDPPFTLLWCNGAFAVRLFFVLSGFVLSRSFFLTNDVRVVQSAAARRYFRLSIPAAASVALAWLLVNTNCMFHIELENALPQPVRFWYRPTSSVLSAVYEAVYGAYWNFNDNTSLNNVLWTLEVEMKGSLLVFAVLALCGTARYRWLLHCCIIIILDCMKATFMVDFIVGLMLCDAHVRIKQNTIWRRAALLLFLGGLVLGDLRSGWLDEVGLEFVQRGERLRHSLGAALIIAGIIRSKVLSFLLEIRPLVMLGSISFAVYLLHVPVMCSVGARSYLLLHASVSDHTTCAYAACVLTLVVTVAASMIVTPVFDRFAIGTGKWVESKLFAHGRGASAV